MERVEVDPEAHIAKAKLYGQYKFECKESSNSEPCSNALFGRLLKAFFTDVSTCSRNNEQCYVGIRLNDDLSSVILPFHLDSFVNCIPAGFEVVESNPECITVSCKTSYYANGNNIIKYITFKDKHWELTISGQTVDLEILDVSNDFLCSKHKIVEICSFVTKVKMCLGVSSNVKAIGSHQVVEIITNDNNSLKTRSVRYESCSRIVPFIGKICCRVCQTIQPNNKRLEQKSKVTPNQTENLTTKEKIKEIIPNATDEMVELINSQVTNMEKTNAKQNRWSKTVLKTCLTLWARSPQAYRDLKTSGLLILPSESLLSAYKNCISQQSGFCDETLHWMYQEAKRQNIPLSGWCGGILIDEMAIQSDLQMVNSGKTVEYVGFTENLKQSTYISAIEEGCFKQKLATHVFQMVFLGFTGFRFPFAHFPVTEAKAHEIHCMVHEAISHLYKWGFIASYINMDGANANRTFVKMNTSSQSPHIYTIPEAIPNRKIFLIMDYSHCMKKIRNNLLKSTKGSKRILTLPSQHVIVWHWWEDAYKWDQTNPIQVHRKLTYEHINPNGAQKMRNHLAEDVLNEDMLYLFQQYQLTLRNGVQLEGVISMLQHTSQLIRNFRDNRPITDSKDVRLTQNKKALEWFDNWEKGLQDGSQLLQCNLISWQSREDLKSCILGFHEMVNEHLKAFPGASITPSRVNSDPIENHFCQQRGLHNGNNTNPNYATYQKTNNTIILGQSTVSKKSNTYKGEKCSQGADSYAFSTPGPLRKKVKLEATTSTTRMTP